MSQERVDNLFASESWSAVYTAFTNVSLKAYDFDTLREALLVYIKQTYPDKFNDYIASSEFVAILDLVAYLGHSLSYRLDMNTRNNFLDLAERKESILRLAKTLGYNKTRPINARGFMKITSAKTDQDIFDNNGVSLANRVIQWNDPNNIDWYENFITIINASLDKNTKIQNPKANLQIETIDHNLYEINENPTSKSVVYPFKGAVAGKSRTFEAVPAMFNDGQVVERTPDNTKKFTIVSRDDNLGPASDRTGFFVLSKLGKLLSETFTYNINITNRVQTISKENISNSDVWVQKVDSSGNIINEVTKLDNETRETAIYNAMRTGSGDMVSVKTTLENGVELHYPDGIFGNSAYGSYRVWYRSVDNESFSVDKTTVKDIPIVIPYIGEDGVAYRLTVTLSSTRDFSENFQAENFISVRRIAPRSYYAQDRMVNAQDYNVLPLSLGQNVVKKVKAINTNFSGNSRYFEMDDVTGHHSNVVVNSKDGSVYIDDDLIQTSLFFNKDKGSSIDFIRNNISRVIKHNSLANKYFINNRNNDNVVNNNFTAIAITIDPLDAKKIIIHEVSEDVEGDTGNHPAFDLKPGDFIKIRTSEGSIFWTQIYRPTKLGSTYSRNEYYITNILPEEQKQDDIFSIVEIVKGYRTRFTEDEIYGIRDKIRDLTEFYIVYIYNETEKQWKWEAKSIFKDYDNRLNQKKPIPSLDEPDFQIGRLIREIYDDGSYEIFIGSKINENTRWSPIDNEIYVQLSYNPSERTIEAEYKIKFSGKKIVFESLNDVKFFYSNEEKIIDVETNMSVQDSISFDFFTPDQVDYMNSIAYSDPQPLAVSVSPLHNLEVTEDGVVTFDTINNNSTTGPRNLEFIRCYDTHTAIESAKYTLMDDNNDDVYELGHETHGHNHYNTIIGNHEEWKMNFTFDKDSDIGSTLKRLDTAYREEEEISESNEYTISEYYFVGGEGNVGNVGNIGNIGNVGNTANYLSATCVLTRGALERQWFKGEPSIEYFDKAFSKKTFFIVDDYIANKEWIETNETPNEELTREDLINSTGVVNTGFITTENDLTWSFVLNDPSGYATREHDTLYNHYWRQFPFGEITFQSHNCLRHPLITDEDEHHSMKIYYDTVTGRKEIDPIHWEVQRISDLPLETEAGDPVNPLNPGMICYNYRVIFWTEDPSDYGPLDVYEVIDDELADITNYKVRTDAMLQLVTTVQSTLPKAKTVKSFIYDKFTTSEGYVDYSKVKMTTIDIKNNPYGMLTMIGNRQIVLEEYTDIDNKLYERVSQEAVVTVDESTIDSDDVIYYYDPLNNRWIERYTGGVGVIDKPAGKRVVSGMSFVDKSLIGYTWDHYADKDKRIDPSTSNIIDLYVLTTDYTRKIEQWKNSGFASTMPKAPNNFELKKTMEAIKGKEAISDHVSYIPVKFKPLFGSQAKQENQAVFKVVKKKGTLYTDSEIKSAVSATVNEYFELENWDFGDTFYFSELAAHIHAKLSEYISSVIITPKYSGKAFTKLLSITSEQNEIFMSVTTSADVKIIDKITDSELLGE